MNCDMTVDKYEQSGIADPSSVNKKFSAFWPKFANLNKKWLIFAKKYPHFARNLADFYIFFSIFWDLSSQACGKLCGKVGF